MQNDNGTHDSNLDRENDGVQYNRIIAFPDPKEEELVKDYIQIPYQMCSHDDAKCDPKPFFHLGCSQ